MKYSIFGVVVMVILGGFLFDVSSANAHNEAAGSHPHPHAAVDDTTPSAGRGVTGGTTPTGKITIDRTTTGSKKIIGPISGSVQDVLESILDIILVFATPIILLFIMYAGWLYVTANGNPEKIKKAHYALFYAVLGGVIILGANLIFDVIKGTIEQI